MGDGQGWPWLVLGRGVGKDAEQRAVVSGAWWEWLE